MNFMPCIIDIRSKLIFFTQINNVKIMAFLCLYIFEFLHVNPPLTGFIWKIGND